METKTPSAVTPGANGQACSTQSERYQPALLRATHNQPPAAIAECLLGRINWQDANSGYCRCPGEQFHTHANGNRDCRVMLDKVPTIHCVHSSCATEIDQANHALRSAIAKAGRTTGQHWRPTPEDERRRRERESYQRLMRRAERSLPEILDGFATDPAELFEESPVRLLDDPSEDWRLLLRLFRPDDVVWIGNQYDSGPGHERNFRRVADWLTGASAPAPLICPNTFKPGVNSRSNANVRHHRYLVVESDTLSKADIAAVFSWCRQFLHLRAIVDTARRSLHGWFDYPTTAQLHELKAVLPMLGCDPALFKPSQPVRLPGARRGKEIQSLVFLDLEGVDHE